MPRFFLRQAIGRQPPQLIIDQRYDGIDCFRSIALDENAPLELSRQAVRGLGEIRAVNALPELKNFRKEDETEGRDFVSGRISRYAPPLAPET